MEKGLLYEIQGYLNALANVLNIFKGSHLYSFNFEYFEKPLKAQQAINDFFNNPNFPINRHNLCIDRLVECSDWQSDLLDTINKWFFNDIAFSQSDAGYIEDETGARTYSCQIFKYNCIAKGLCDILRNLFGKTQFQTYRVITSVSEQDEFAWEQYVFEADDYSYILQFYRQG